MDDIQCILQLLIEFKRHSIRFPFERLLYFPRQKIIKNRQVGNIYYYYFVKSVSAASSTAVWTLHQSKTRGCLRTKCIVVRRSVWKLAPFITNKKQHCLSEKRLHVFFSHFKYNASLTFHVLIGYNL